MFHLNFGEKTDTGRARKANEDCITTSKTEQGHLFVVCDGMGGHAGGQVASKVCSSAITAFFNMGHALTPDEALQESFSFAHEKVKEKASKNPSLHNMGTTAVALFISANGEAHFAHVGDSRLYLLRQQTLQRLTTDHTVVQDLVNKGSISLHEAEKHPESHVLTNAVGFHRFWCELGQRFACQDNDLLLLCSDGLTNMVNERAIREILEENELSAQDKADLLVKMANFKGGLDNISAIVVGFHRPHVPKKEPVPIVEQQPVPQKTESNLVPKHRASKPSEPLSDFAAVHPETKAWAIENRAPLMLVGFLIFVFITGFLFSYNKYQWNRTLKASTMTIDSLKQINQIFKNQVSLKGQADVERFRAIRRNYFDSQDKNNFRMYGLYRDKTNDMSLDDVSEKFHIYNTNAIKQTDLPGERWFIVPVKGVHFLYKGQSLASVAETYYDNPSDTTLIREFNPVIKPNSYLFIPYNH